MRLRIVPCGKNLSCNRFETMSSVAAINPVASQSLKEAANSLRLSWLDFTRLAAAYSIVWLHTLRSPELVHWSRLGRFAVPFFTAGAVFFAIEGLRRKPNRSIREYTVNRFRRIYLPFLAWSLIYVLFKGVKKIALPDEPNDFGGIAVLWTGTYFHLWFMPFILAATLSAFVIGKFLVGRAHVEWPLSGTMLALGIVVASISPPAWVVNDSDFSSLAWDALPAACWGVGLALIYQKRLARLISNRITTVFSVCAFVILIGWLMAFGRNTIAENAAGFILLIAALQPDSPHWVQRVGRFGSVAFGIYLAHMLLVKVCESAATKLHLPISWELDLAIFAIAVVGSTWLAWVLARSRHTRWLAA